MRYAAIILTNVCRLVLSVTFILSGYVKAIDPLGTQYKITDYLEALSLNGVFPTGPSCRLRSFCRLWNSRWAYCCCSPYSGA